MMKKQKKFDDVVNQRGFMGVVMFMFADLRLRSVTVLSRVSRVTTNRRLNETLPQIK